MPKLKHEANFSYLLIGLLITLVAGPLAVELDLQRPSVTVQVTFAVTLLVSVWSAIDSKTWFYFGIGLALVNALASVANHLEPSRTAATVALSCTFVFCAFSIAFTATHLFQAGTYKIDRNRLVGAISVYLLLGIGFAVLNMMIELWSPGSFAGLKPGENSAVGIELIYFSFVTLTTLGYGDVTPVRPMAQAIAYIGVIAGQFYIAVLVAGLVGTYISQQIVSRNRE
jgi:voltage-gated potassium channel